MKIFTNRKFTQKLIIAIISITLFNFCFVPGVRAAGNFGGEMMGIMKPFVTAIADVVGTVVQYAMTGKWIDAVDMKSSGVVTEGTRTNYFVNSDKFEYPILQISPEIIFANEVEFLDANFITSPQQEKEYLLSVENDTTLQKLRNIIAGWYVTLRTISVIGLLSVLIYIGIRIIISSTSADKAKYKQRIVDWIVAFCLLFFMHYIMAATVTVVDKVNSMLAKSTNVYDGMPIDPEFGTVKFTASTTNQPMNGYGIMDGFPDNNDTYKTPNLQVETVEETIQYNVHSVNVNGTIKTLMDAYDDGDITADYDAVPPIGEDGATSAYSVTYRASGQSLKITYALEASKYNGNTHWCVKNVTCQIIGSASGNVSFFREHTEDTKNAAGSKSISLNEYINFYNDEVSRQFYNSYTPPTVVGGNSREGTALVASQKGPTVRIAEAATTDGSRVLYFTNYARLFLNAKSTDENASTATAYLIIYVALIVFTAVFAFRYIKRVIYIAFLTLIAPTVALTYPLDKIKDRKSTSMEYVV